MEEKNITLVENLLSCLEAKKAKNFEFLSKRDQSLIVSIVNEYSEYLEITFGIMHRDNVILPYYKRVVSLKEYGDYVRKLIKECKNVIKEYNKEKVLSLRKK